MPKAEIQIRCALRFCVVVVLGLCAGCQTEKVTTSDGWPLPPAPRATPVPPAGLKVDQMAFMVGSKADDSDNNGYPDTIRASVALFSNDHPTALREDGTFSFMLYEQGQTAVPGSKPFAEWHIEGEAVKRAMSMAQYGPCYIFTLSLLETPVGDKLPTERADMICQFQPADGAAAVQSMGVRTLQVGGRMR